jgi:hypothetical protein
MKIFRKYFHSKQAANSKTAPINAGQGDISGSA